MGYITILHNKKIIRENHTPFMNKELSQVIIEKSRLLKAIIDIPLMQPFLLTRNWKTNVVV